MSYRINLNKCKKNALNEYLKRTEDTFFNESGELELKRITELNSNTDLEEFTKIGRFNDDEYFPMILDKKDILVILEYYHNFIYDSIKEKLDYLDKILELEENRRKDKISIDREELISIWSNYLHMVPYFKGKFNPEELVSSSALFLLDYFFIAKNYETIKDDEVFIITHG